MSDHFGAFGCPQTKENKRWRKLHYLSVLTIHLEIPLVPKRVRDWLRKKVSETAQY